MEGGANVSAVKLLDKDKTALVVVDLQEKLVPAISEKERVLKNALLLMHAASVLEIPIVLTTQNKKGLGATLPEVVDAAPGVEAIDKVSFGCFGDDRFLARLAALAPRKQLVVAGIESHICVAQTVLGALAHRYEVHVATDATGSRSEANRQVGLHRMEQAGALLSSSEMAIYELLRRSDGDAFKRILPRLKQ
jgi:nicotinamidase-related amidase